MSTPQPRKRYLFSIGLLVFAIALLIALSHASLQAASPAERIIVDTPLDEIINDGNCSLREAITAANNDTAIDGCVAGDGADTLIVPAGTYSLTLAGPREDDNQSGDLDVYGSLVISGAGHGETIIDGAQLDRVLHVHATANVTMHHLTLQNGLAPNGEDDEVAAPGNGGSGAGLLNAGTLQLQNVHVRNNRTGRGGDGGENTPEQGGSAGAGGGLYNSGTVTLNQSLVQGNQTGRGGIAASDDGLIDQDGFGGDGGGLYNVGEMTLIQSTVGGNRTGEGGIAGHGAGLYNGGTLRIRQSTIHDNRTSRARPSFSPPTSTGGNGGFGGGIFNSGSMHVINSTISGNETASGGDNPRGGTHAIGGIGGFGAGIYNHSSGSVQIDHSTIALNQTGEGGSSFLHEPRGGNGGGIAASGNVTLNNTMALLNVAAGEGNDCSGTLESVGHNLFGDVAACTILSNGIGNLVNPDAMLSALGDNGGHATTHAIAFNHPAANAGSCLAIDGSTVQLDQRGMPRPSDTACDIGAYEAPAPDQFVFLPFRIIQPAGIELVPR